MSKPIKALLYIGIMTLLTTACKPNVTDITPGDKTAEAITQGEATSIVETEIHTSEPHTPVEHPVGIRKVNGEAEFFTRETNASFILRGTNYIHIVRTESGKLQDRLMGTANFDPETIRNNLARLRELGYNTVRIFIDSCSEGTTCIGRVDGTGLNPDYMDNVARMMTIAKEEDILLIITSNDIPNGGGYAEISDRDPSADPMVALYRNGQMLTPSGQKAYHTYWQDIMQALHARKAPFDAVLAWELFNEQWLFGNEPPLSLNKGNFTGPNGINYDLSDPQQKRDLVADAIALYIEMIRSVILETDPEAFVTMGFFAPDFPNTTAIGDVRFVDTAALVERNVPLDFYDIHAYPGDDLNFEEFMQNFGLEGYSDKPIILGEYGSFNSRYETVEAAARASGAWMAGFCKTGLDGYLYWTLTDLPEALGDPTWGLLEEEDFMLELFAPINQPDPCQPPEVPSDNLAYGASVSASNSLPEEHASYINDENTTTYWGSGEPAPQWVEVDLGEEMTISEIRLLTSQSPAGNTVHEIRVRGSDTAYETVRRIEGFTEDLQWLTFSPETPLENIQYIWIYTLSSPSWVGWREIEVR